MFEITCIISCSCNAMVQSYSLNVIRWFVSTRIPNLNFAAMLLLFLHCCDHVIDIASLNFVPFHALIDDFLPTQFL